MSGAKSVELRAPVSPGLRLRRPGCAALLLTFTSVMPRTVFRISSSTFFGPDEFTVPGACCRNAVCIAVRKTTLPFVFCITW